MLGVVMMTKIAWQVNEEVSRDKSGKADKMNNLEVDSKDQVDVLN